MNISTIKIGYSDGKKILEKMNFEFMENLQKSKSLLKTDFSREFIQASYSDSYKNLYDVARKNADYNILLTKTLGLFQFGYEVNERGEIRDVRFAYYDSPYLMLSYEAFLKENGFDFEEYGDELIDDYNQYVDEAPLKQTGFTTIRYDYSVNQYEGVEHPLSHLHIGHENEIRIPMKVIMTPRSFISFVVRQIYWGEWKLKLSDESFRNFYLSSKTSEHRLSREQFNLEEEKDFHIF